MDSIKARITSQKFLRDTVIMMIAMTLSNFFNYLYQLLVGRLLTPQEYGELFSLLSLFYILSVLFTTINTSITKFTLIYGVRGEYGKIKAILINASRDFATLGMGMYGVLVLLSPFISKFLRIENNIFIVILFASMPFGLILPVYQGTLRGLQRFGALGVSVSSWAFFKLLFGFGLVLLGYGVLGGIIGVFLAHVATFVITLIFLRDLFDYEYDGLVDIGKIVQYGGLTFLVTFAYTTMWNIDVIFVKHYLSPLEAGYYSAISVLGKIALFAPGAIGVVVFPKTAERYERGEQHFHLLLKALVLASLISGSVVLIYALFPEFIITFVYGEKYLGVAPYLWKYGLAMTFFALSGVIINYLLSIAEMRILRYLMGILIIEIIALTLVRTVSGIINILIGVGFILVSVLSISAGRKA
ncbi:capsular biosynthesis protein [Thermococcus sp. MV11]|nr:oligosaccharide flippase family protein [Thermococcus sp. MV11]NJE03857.1 capsular biosynthesis protein [Thermococcus sp. MV11]